MLRNKLQPTKEEKKKVGRAGRELGQDCGGPERPGEAPLCPSELGNAMGQAQRASCSGLPQRSRDAAGCSLQDAQLGKGS